MNPIILTALLITSAPLDGGKYRVDTVSGGKAEHDTLTFEKGMIHSLECDQYGFAPAPYQAKKNGDAIEFDSTIKSKTEGVLRISGKVVGTAITGGLVWKKQGQKDIEYTMSGQLDRSAERAAAARADIQKTFGFVPAFMNQIPASVLPGGWQEMKSLEMNPSTALSGKVKELIGLAVASQIPCVYCTTAHTKFAGLNGATDEELGEAVAMAALTRHWSTYLNGLQYDDAKFQKEIAQVIEHAKKGGTKPELDVVDVKSARADIERAMGTVPGFLAQFPEVATAGAWREYRDVEVSDMTALSAKTKHLIGLAVAAQIPCRYCVEAHTAIAKLAGASDAEIHEAIAMAAMTRHWSTLLNGLQVDRAQFEKDLDKLVAGAKSKGKRES